LPHGASVVERFEHGGAELLAEAAGASADRHVVFLHGWGGSRESLRGIAILFQHTARVHLLDLPGFGEAPPPPPSWGTLEYADLVQQYLLDRVKGDTVLIGHSFGSRVTIRLAARRLPQVRAMVLMAAPGLPAAGLSWRRVRRLGIRWLRKAAGAVKPFIGSRGIDWHTERFASADYRAAGELRPVFVRVVNEDLTESARSAACPALLIYGTDDAETPTSVGRRYLDLMKGHAALELLPHKDHHLYTGTGAHLCAFKIRTWLDGLRSGPASTPAESGGRGLAGSLANAGSHES
jgi:pimeloyl-ACP methyl ester carboxylesterase